MTIIHRWLFCQDINNFFETIGIKRKEMHQIMTIISVNIKKSLDSGENSSLCFKMILLFLDNLLIFSSFGKAEEYMELLNDINEILECISSKIYFNS